MVERFPNISADEMARRVQFLTSLNKRGISINIIAPDYRLCVPGKSHKATLWQLAGDPDVSLPSRGPTAFDPIEINGIRARTGAALSEVGLASQLVFAGMEFQLPHGVPILLISARERYEADWMAWLQKRSLNEWSVLHIGMRPEGHA